MPLTFGSIHVLPDEVLAADILARLPRPYLWAPCPWEQVCRRWRRVYSHSQAVWQGPLAAQADVSLLLSSISHHLNHGFDDGQAEQQEALETGLAIMRRRAPALRVLWLSIGYLPRQPQQQLPSLTDLLQLFAAAPLDRLQVTGTAQPEALQLLAAQQGATLTSLDWVDLRTPPGWGAAWPHLAGLTALRRLTVSVGTRTPPAGLVAGIQQLRGLRELSIRCHAWGFQDPDGQSQQEQQQHAEGVSFDLGFLAESAATLQFLFLELATPPASPPGHSPPQITLPAALAGRLTALTHISISARGWSTVNFLDCLPAICNVTLLGVKSEGDRLWHASSVQTLRIQEATLEGPPSSDFNALGCQLESLFCRDCTLPKRGFPQSLCRLPLLTQLELVNCKLGERGLLDPLPGLLADLPLAFLSLGGNGLDQVPAVVPHLSGLVRLNLNNNRLSNLPASMTCMRNLSMLELAGNRLAAYPSVLYDMFYIALLDLSHNPLRPTDLDPQRLEKDQCFWQSDTGTCWLFMGEDPSFGMVGRYDHWTSDDMNAAVTFAKMLPRCELRLGDRERASIIVDEWRQHFHVWGLGRITSLSLHG